MDAVKIKTDFDKHVLIGHSQGTLIAARVATKFQPIIAGVVLLAGIGLPGRQSLLDQHVSICKAEGWSDDDISLSLAQKEALFDILSDTQATIDAGFSKTDALKDLKNKLFEAFLGEFKLADITDQERRDLSATIEDLLEWEWRFLLGIDPALDLHGVSCPVLGICGDKDSQVHAERNLAAIKDACTRGSAKSIDVNVVADHNHLFQKTGSAALSDYRSLGTPITDEVVSMIVSWLSQMRLESP